MKLPEAPAETRDRRAPRSALIAIIVILAGMALVSIYSNVQRWRRAKVDTVIVTPIVSPSPSP